MMYEFFRPDSLCALLDYNENNKEVIYECEH